MPQVFGLVNVSDSATFDNVEFSVTLNSGGSLRFLVQCQKEGSDVSERCKFGYQLINGASFDYISVSMSPSGGYLGLAFGNPILEPAVAWTDEQGRFEYQVQNGVGYSHNVRVAVSLPTGGIYLSDQITVSAK